MPWIGFTLIAAGLGLALSGAYAEDDKQTLIGALVGVIGLIWCVLAT